MYLFYSTTPILLFFSFSPLSPLLYYFLYIYSLLYTHLSFLLSTYNLSYSTFIVFSSYLISFVPILHYYQTLVFLNVLLFLLFFYSLLLFLLSLHINYICNIYLPFFFFLSFLCFTFLF